MKKFSDFASEQGPLEGKKVKLDEVINKEIQVINFKIKKSKYDRSNHNNNYLTLQIIDNHETKVIFTGSAILAEQCEKYESEMPFITTIKKVNTYYTFT